MAKKGKEFEFAGLRIQIDPLVLIRRIAMRQIPMLLLVASIGGVITIGAYLKTPKRYQSTSRILIRYESFRESYLRKLLNVAAGYLGSDTEMMLILNELDLYPEVRTSKPYEIALYRLRKELDVDPDVKQISVKFMSEDPRLAQRIVAFTTERIMNKIASLNEAPFNRQLDAIERSISDIEPKKTDAERQLFEFKAKHPRIAMQVSGLLIDENSPLNAVQNEIRQAESDLGDARAGRVSKRTTKIRDTEATRELARRADALDSARARFTENHPEVLRRKEAVRDQQAVVEEEAAALEGRNTVGDPGELQRARVARAEGRLKALLDRKIEAEKRVINKPRLQREWAELSLQASALTSEYRSLIDRRNKVRNDRLIAANTFQENFRLVDKARVPQLPKEPKKGKFVGIGVVITALLGLGLALSREAFRQTFVDATEFEEQTGLQVFAVLPHISNEKEA